MVVVHENKKKKNKKWCSKTEQKKITTVQFGGFLEDPIPFDGLWSVLTVSFIMVGRIYSQS